MNNENASSKTPSDLISMLRMIQNEATHTVYRKPETMLKIYRDIDDLCIKLLADSVPDQPETLTRKTNYR